MSQFEQFINEEIGRRNGEMRKLDEKIAEQNRVVSALHGAMRPEVERIISLFKSVNCEVAEPCVFGAIGINLKSPHQSLVLAVSGSEEFMRGVTIGLHTADARGNVTAPIFQIKGVTSPDGETLCDANDLVDKPIPTAKGLIEEMLKAYLRDFPMSALVHAVPQPPAAPMEHHLTFDGHVFRIKGEPGQACSIESQWRIEFDRSGDEAVQTSAEQVAYAVLEAQILALYSEGVLIQNNAVNPAVLRSLQTVMDALPNIVDEFEEDDSSDTQVPADPAPRG